MTDSTVPVGCWLNSLQLVDQCPGCGGVSVYSLAERPNGTWIATVAPVDPSGIVDIRDAVTLCDGVSREEAIGAAESHRLTAHGAETH